MRDLPKNISNLFRREHRSETLQGTEVGISRIRLVFVMLTELAEQAYFIPKNILENRISILLNAHYPHA